MVNLQQLEEKIAGILPEVVEFRHALHRIPEIAGKEFKTSALLREKLSQLRLDVKPPFLETDVVALMNTEKAGNLTLRADIDALPVNELDDKCPYRSTHPGMMHACGHDGHTATLYGAAKILSELRQDIPCSVRFLFQPGEEMACLGEQVLKAGALLAPEPDFITGLHNWPNEPFGKINTKAGILMAAAGFFRIVLHGKGGHGSLPHLANNPIDCATDIMQACRAIIPDECVLTFCSCNAGSFSAVIPETAELQGTIRFLDPEKGKAMLRAFEETVRTLSEKREIRCEFSCPVPYPPVINRQTDFDKVKTIMLENLGDDAFSELPSHVMSSEDFAWYLQKYHGVFCHLGSGESTPLHSNRYDFDDRLLAAGIRYFCLMALRGDQLCRH